MSFAPSRAADSAIAHAMLCLFATPRIRPFLPSRSISSLFSLSFFYCHAGSEDNTALNYNHAIMIRLDSTQTPPLVREDDGAALIIGSRRFPLIHRSQNRSSHQRAWRQVDDVARDGQDRLEEMRESGFGIKTITGRQ